MNPQTQFCHNPQCPARGQVGQGNIRVHSQTEQRYRCITCGQTFAATKGTPFYGLRTTADLVTTVLTLLGHGCPIQALVAAFGLDARTVAAWVARAGQHGQQMHQHVVQQGQVDLQHVQADELWVKLVGRRVWMAMALAVPSRLWLGGVLSPQRDLLLITTLVQLVRSCAGSLAILVCVDGLASYVTAFLRVFRHPMRTGRRGRPRLVLEEGLLLGQMVKRYARRRVVSVERRVVRGTEQAIATVLASIHTGTGINTAYIERLNATFRASLAPLVRRGRAIAHTEAVLTAGM
jgi:transposase-like protein